MAADRVVDGGNPAGARLTVLEVERIVNAAAALVEAHDKRNPEYGYITLNEDAALFELNYRLGAYRQAKGRPRGR
jgi:hypothetical protein